MDVNFSRRRVYLIFYGKEDIMKAIISDKKQKEPGDYEPKEKNY